MFCCATSCSKGVSSDSPQNPLVGTLWEEDDDVPLRMEFTTASSVSVWGGYRGTDTGTYKVSGNSIIFTNLETEDGYYRYISATFTNNTMVVSYYISDLPDVYKIRLYKK